ncbi:ABC transporter permease [Streptomyces erythrochromogenes]|uniref:ABC transporter permease n=1 Tax=Streptomyces erythrochromogenes TaxID=285574 RepID=UPI002256BE9B|nr:ABC transporter permease [Streptomyces erythrochromogenes]MCX5588610.1 ABC transporter permease [Streptomyces erythrochromogenes]
MNAAPSALREMVKTNARELFRDGKTAFFTVLFPLLFLAMFLGLGALTAGGSYRIAVVDSPEQQTFVNELAQVEGFHAEPWKGSGPLPAGELGGFDAVVAVSGGQASVVVDASRFGALKGLRSALAAGGVDDSRTDFRTPDGGVPFDPLKAALPTGLLMALMSTAFFGTATPLIALRTRGTLRLLGTTPLGRLTFVLAQAPVRLALVVVQLVILGMVAVAMDFMSLADTLRLMGTGLLGAIMLFAFGYLMAARLRNAEVVNGLLGLLMPVLLFFSGLFLPLSMLPSVITTVSDALPTTYLVDAFNHDLNEAASVHSLTTDWLVLLAATAVFGGLAARLFRWDQGEDR